MLDQKVRVEYLNHLVTTHIKSHKKRQMFGSSFYYREMFVSSLHSAYTEVDWHTVAGKHTVDVYNIYNYKNETT